MPVLALTATATKKVKKTVIESLSLKKDMVLIEVNPNRPNIYLTVKKIPHDLGSSFKWLVKKLKEEMNTMGRVLIYCKTIKDCGSLFTYFKNELGSEAFYPPGAEQISNNMLVGMYHHATLQKHKERIINSLHDTEGKCRIVIATNALGMGVNFKDIRTVIHYGPPRHMDDFIQEIGRAGQDNLKSKCDMYVKQYATNTEKCFREILLSEFDSPFKPHETSHNCCSVCHQKCSCLATGECSVNVDSCFISPTCTSTQEQRSRLVNKEQKYLLRELLLDMRHRLHDNSYYLIPDSSTGFTDSLLDLIVKNCKHIFNLDYITNNFPVFREDHAMEILRIIKDVFNDTDYMNDIPESNGSEFVHSVGELLPVYDLEYGGNYSPGTEKHNDSSSDEEDTELLQISETDE